MFSNWLYLYFRFWSWKWCKHGVWFHDDRKWTVCTNSRQSSGDDDEQNKLSVEHLLPERTNTKDPKTPGAQYNMASHFYIYTLRYHTFILLYISRAKYKLLDIWGWKCGLRGSNGSEQPSFVQQFLLTEVGGINKASRFRRFNEEVLAIQQTSTIPWKSSVMPKKLMETRFESLKLIFVVQIQSLSKHMFLLCWWRWRVDTFVQLIQLSVL